MTNPYRPGAGRRPPLLAGREQVLGVFDVLRRRAEELGEGDRGWILTGLRGVGKTVLLNKMLYQVGGRGWITAKVEADTSASLAASLSQSLLRALRTPSGATRSSGYAGCSACSRPSASTSTRPDP